MEFVRSDYEQTLHMMVNYIALPQFDGDSEPTYDFAPFVDKVFLNYEEAAKFAMSALKFPEMIFSTFDEAVIEKIKTIQGIYIIEELLVFDKANKSIECPEEYMYDVGYIYKYYGDEEEEETPRLLS